MITAIASENNYLKSYVDSHFGRARFFCIVDDKGDVNFLENPSFNLSERAGIDAAEFLIAKDVKSIVAGRFGSKVLSILRENNIQMIVVEKKITVSEIIKQIKINQKYEDSCSNKG